MPANLKSWLVAGALGLLIGVISTRWTTRGATSTNAPRVRSEREGKNHLSQDARVVVPAEIDRGVIREEVARGVAAALADERKTAQSEPAPLADSPPADMPPPSLAVENVAAVAAAEAVLARGKEARRWTASDRAEFRRALQGASREEIKRVKREVIMAINSGELSYELGATE